MLASLITNRLIINGVYLCTHILSMNLVIGVYKALPSTPQLPAIEYTTSFIKPLHTNIAKVGFEFSQTCYHLEQFLNT